MEFLKNHFFKVLWPHTQRSEFRSRAKQICKAFEAKKKSYELQQLSRNKHPLYLYISLNRYSVKKYFELELAGCGDRIISSKKRHFIVPWKEKKLRKMTPSNYRNYKNRYFYPLIEDLNYFHGSY